jgi:hypothetical protein
MRGLSWLSFFLGGFVGVSVTFTLLKVCSIIEGRNWLDRLGEYWTLNNAAQKQIADQISGLRDKMGQEWRAYYETVNKQTEREESRESDSQEAGR